MSATSSAAPAPAYSLPLRTLHWLVAALILLAIVFGVAGILLPKGDFRGEVIAFHKSLGLTVFAFAALRLLVRLIEKAPEYTPKLSALNHAAAGLVHLVLYATMFLLPLSGFVHSQTGNHPVSWFGAYTLPAILPINEAVDKGASQAHYVFALALGAALALHVAAALWHAWVKKDLVFSRMWPSWRP